MGLIGVVTPPARVRVGVRSPVVDDAAPCTTGFHVRQVPGAQAGDVRERPPQYAATWLPRQLIRSEGAGAPRVPGGKRLWEEEMCSGTGGKNGVRSAGGHERGALPHAPEAGVHRR